MYELESSQPNSTHRSKIAGDPKAPLEITTKREAYAIRGGCDGDFPLKSSRAAYSTPIAQLFLSMFAQLEQ